MISPNGKPKPGPRRIMTNPPTNVPYTIQRRPAPTPNAREISLPTNVVIDLTTWAQRVPGTLAVPARGHQSVHGLCRHPALSQRHGRSDHDLFDAVVVRHVGRILPLLAGRAQRRVAMQLDQNGNPVQLVTASRCSCRSAPSSSSSLIPATLTPARRLQGEYRIVTLFTRTGQITTSDNVQFDNPLNPANGSTYNPGYPFLAVEQGGLDDRKSGESKKKAASPALETPPEFCAVCLTVESRQSHDRQVGTTTGTKVVCCTAIWRGTTRATHRLTVTGNLLGNGDGHLARGGLGDHPARRHGDSLDPLFGDVLAGGDRDRLDALLGHILAGAHLVGLDALLGDVLAGGDGDGLDALLGDHLARADLVGLDVLLGDVLAGGHGDRLDPLLGHIAAGAHLVGLDALFGDVLAGGDGNRLDPLLGDVAAGRSRAPGAPSFRGRSGSR